MNAWHQALAGTGHLEGRQGVDSHRWLPVRKRTLRLGYSSGRKADIPNFAYESLTAEVAAPVWAITLAGVLGFGAAARGSRRRRAPTVRRASAR